MKKVTMRDKIVTRFFPLLHTSSNMQARMHNAQLAPLTLPQPQLHTAAPRKDGKMSSSSSISGFHPASGPADEVHIITIMHLLRYAQATSSALHQV